MTVIVALAATLALLVVGIIVGLLLRRRGKLRGELGPGYRVFFIIGLIWVPLGAAMMIASLFLDISVTIGLPFLTIGVAYLVLGLAHRDRWRVNSPPG